LTWSQVSIEVHELVSQRNLRFEDPTLFGIVRQLDRQLDLAIFIATEPLRVKRRFNLRFVEGRGRLGLFVSYLNVPAALSQRGCKFRKSKQKNNQ
jgi:hypothetical protein